MDRVTEALERARATSRESHGSLAAEPGRTGWTARGASRNTESLRASPRKTGQSARGASELPFTQITLTPSALEARRISALDSNSPQTRYYDMLRNHLMDGLGEGASQSIGVTSPTSGCGVTVTAVNLAFSLARLQAKNVLLVDANRRGKGVWSMLRLPAAVESGAGLSAGGTLARVDVDEISLHVLDARRSLTVAGDSADTHRRSSLIKKASADLGPVVVVVDLPPMLVDDDVIPMLSEIDTALLVLAVGQSNVADLEACKTYFASKMPVQVVLNKTRWHGL